MSAFYQKVFKNACEIAKFVRYNLISNDIGLVHATTVDNFSTLQKVQIMSVRRVNVNHHFKDPFVDACYLNTSWCFIEKLI